MDGTFHIIAAADAEGITTLRHRKISAPFHLSRPYWDGHALTVQMVHMAAGVFSGDTLSIRAEVETGAKVLLTAPSAQRIHTMPDGSATTRQHYQVAPGGWLEVWPEWFIPQRDCHHRQHTSLDVAGGGEAYLVETLTPGRVAHGEWFDFRRLEWETTLTVDGHLIVHEVADLTGPDCRDRLRLPNHKPGAYYAAVYIVTPRNVPFRDVQTILHSAASWIGVTQLAPNVYTVKLIAPDSESLRTGLGNVRDTFQPYLPPLKVNPRKL